MGTSERLYGESAEGLLQLTQCGGDIGHFCDPESLNQGICPDLASFHN